MFLQRHTRMASSSVSDPGRRGHAPSVDEAWSRRDYATLAPGPARRARRGSHRLTFPGCYEQREHRSRLPVDRPSQNFAAGRILRPLLPSGHLVYIHQGVLFGVKFDLEKLETRGAPVPLLEDVAANSATGGGQLDFSGPGTVVYAAGKNAAQAWQVVWLDGSGKTHPLVAAPGAYAHPRLSPDGRKLAFLGNGDIYIHDLSGRLPPPSPSRVMLTARYGRPTANISSSSPCRMASAFSGCAATAREIRNHCSSGRIL